MIVDTSAIVAYFLKESSAERIESVLLEAEETGISSATLLECAIVLSHRLGSDIESTLDGFLVASDINIIPFIGRHYQLAYRAFRIYGKGRGHRAKLNFGDCLTYATAKLADMPLLYIGDDFTHTDLKLITL